MATLKEVAERANVSVMTASRALNHTGKVAPERERRVKEAAEALGYRPNLLARSMITKSAKTIGVLYSNIYNQIYADQIVGIEAVAQEAGYSIILANVYDYDSVISSFSTLVSKQVDGIILLQMELKGIDEEISSNAVLEQISKVQEYIEKYFCQSGAKPGVAVGQQFSCEYISHVYLDYAQGVHLAMDHLFACGFTDIVNITSFWNEKGVWKERVHSYIEEMKAHGLESKIHVERTENSVEGGYRSMLNLLDSGRLPEAILCGNDYMAIGVLRAAAEKRIPVPERISVMGQDGLLIGDMVYPRLSTVSVNGMACGKAAMRMLLEHIDDVKKEPQYTVIGQSLLLRQSTKNE